MRNDAIYDITKWLIPSLLLVMTLSTVWINCTSSNEKKDTWKAINNLQLEVDTLKSAKQIQDLSKTILDSISSKHWK